MDFKALTRAAFGQLRAALPLALFFLAASQPAAYAAGVCATTAQPDMHQALQAAREGENFAVRHEGYGVTAWVLYQSADPLRAQPGRPGVDAVIVETPVERIRNESYLLRYQGLSVSPAAVARMRRQTSGTLGFIVYAHSRSDSDRGFMGGYTRASMTLDDKRHLVANDTIRFGPSSDFYDVGSFREARWTGSLTYRFTLPPAAREAPCAIAGILRFADGHGRSYAHRFALAHFR